ncbi:ATP-binding protein [Persephonella sp.]|uniref:ATP-binding protein n=1 Tax=Persephonella sp. TaxID=2060922 RepID=UPI0025CEC71F|nr:ATP-binding protein [Persephonella sp.]
MIKRAYDLKNLIKKNRVLVLYGARRVGKTTLLKDFLNKINLKYKLDTGENIKLQELFETEDINKILEYTENYELIAIDEAQYLKNTGKALKMIVDYSKDIYVVVTGSSSFELQGQIGEPLTGRKRTFLLFPLSISELNTIYNKFELKEHLEDFLIFGSYPEVITSKTKNEKIEILEELVNSYLLKDILSFERVKSSSTLLNLLRLIAFQVGQLVSINELSTQLKIDIKTAQRYLDLLEKTFVIKKLEGFSRNPRKEITSKCKYYFIDNGIRNAVISNYNPLNLRNDKGALWENFFVMEKIKKTTYERNLPVSYKFWRAYGGQEIDLIEISNDKIKAYELKYQKQKVKIPPLWQKNYSDTEFNVVTNDNFLEFLV